MVAFESYVWSLVIYVFFVATIYAIVERRSARLCTLEQSMHKLYWKERRKLAMTLEDVLKLLRSLKSELVKKFEGTVSLYRCYYIQFRRDELDKDDAGMRF